MSDEMMAPLNGCTEVVLMSVTYLQIESEMMVLDLVHLAGTPVNTIKNYNKDFCINSLSQSPS